MDRAIKQGNTARQLNWTLTSCDEDGENSEINVVLCVHRSPSGERRSKKAMKIQSQQRSSGAASGSPGPGPRLGPQEDDSEVEGEFSPANSGVDPNFLRKIKKATDLSKSDQEVRKTEIKRTEVTYCNE